MFGRVPKSGAAFLGTRPNVSESHSEISTRVPFCIAAGLFRHVWLMKRNPVHLTTWGTFVAPRVSAATIASVAGPTAAVGRLRASASLNISAVVAAAQGFSGSVSASFDVFGPSGARVATGSASKMDVVAGGEVTLRATFSIATPVQLWTIRAPTLYTVRSRLLSSTGELLDEDTTTTGFRPVLAFEYPPEH